MLELFRENPWLVVVCLALAVPILGIVFATMTKHLTTVRHAELEAGLKQDMLARGMSAQEIRMVIEATSRRKGKTCASESVARQEVS
jgi:hypothetical protein